MAWTAARITELIFPVLPLFQCPQARKRLLLVIAVPLILISLGMVLNSIGLSFDQPPSSPEQDPAKRLAAEREAYRQFFDRQRSRAVKRQNRVNQYGWLLLIVTIGSFIWLYVDTVNKTTISNRIAALQTLGSQEGKDMVLSLTLSDGSNVKYLIKAPEADNLKLATNEARRDGKGFILGIRETHHGFEHRQ